MRRAGSPELATIWIAVLCALVLRASLLTPPFGFAPFFVEGAAPPSVRLVDVYRGIDPVVAAPIAVIAAVPAWPIIALELATRVLAE